MAHHAVFPDGFPRPTAPYSPGVRAGNVIHMSGIVALDGDGSCFGIGDAAAQTRRVLDTIKAIVEAAGGTMRDIAFNQIFLKDLTDYAVMNGVYKEYFSTDLPARYCIRADLVRPEFLVEIASTAYLTTK